MSIEAPGTTDEITGIEDFRSALSIDGHPAPTDNQLRFAVLNGALERRGVTTPVQLAIIESLEAARSQDGSSLALNPTWAYQQPPQ